MTSINISGAWLGTYWQDDDQTRFEATFAQGGNTLSGNILDDGALGEAQIVGEVIGRSIQFTKRYLTSSSYPVDYAGVISEDANSISGTWTISGTRMGKRKFSGTWEAHRSGNDLMAELTQRLAQKVPATVGTASSQQTSSQ